MLEVSLNIKMIELFKLTCINSVEKKYHKGLVHKTIYVAGKRQGLGKYFSLDGSLKWFPLEKNFYLDGSLKWVPLEGSINESYDVIG
jgi:hypothetical protein